MLIFKKIKLFLRELFRAVPKIGFLYVLCQRYVDDYRGEHNSDMNTNGELRFIRRNLGKFKIVFDIGANKGEWARFILSLNKDIYLHCFEPSSFTFQKLLKNDFPKNVICNNFGLGSKKETKELFVVGDGSGGNSLYKRTGVNKEAGSEEKVSIDTFENYCLERSIREVDFVKIDTEGHDLEVMKGMGGLLKEGRIKMIQLEYGGCNIDARVLLKDIFDLFKGTNYKIYKIFPNRVEVIEKYKQDLENFRYANYLIARKEINL